MKRLMMIAAATVLVSALLPLKASAHVLLMDTTNSKGAILHIMPDDDPIAGQESDMYFDRQGVGGASSADVSLIVRNSGGEAAPVEVRTTNTLSTATYTFPEQGVYNLTFTVRDASGEYRYEQSQRVTRGVASADFNSPQYYWAEALLVGSAVGVLVLFILIFNRRKEIAKQSTF